MAKKRGQAKPRSKVVKLTAKLRQKLALQEKARKQRQKQRQQRQQALDARDSYKPRKGDRGKIVFIGVHGQRTARAKGRKGFLIYVTKTGKKWFVKQQTKRGEYKPRKFAEIQPGA